MSAAEYEPAVDFSSRPLREGGGALPKRSSLRAIYPNNPSSNRGIRSSTAAHPILFAIREQKRVRPAVPGSEFARERSAKSATGGIFDQRRPRLMRIWARERMAPWPILNGG